MSRKARLHEGGGFLSVVLPAAFLVLRTVPDTYELFNKYLLTE